MVKSSERRNVILTVDIRFEQDVVLARQRARQIAALLGFDQQDQTRIATATSEIARNAFRYTGGGSVEFRVAAGALLITVSDQGQGIAHLKQVMAGRYQSQTGMGMGLVGAKRLMDRFEVETTPGKGTVVLLGKDLPRGIAEPLAAELAAELARQTPRSPLEEVQEQNRELIRTLDELRDRQAELGRVNRELEDTNRGVVALYAELDDRADYLQRANELKTRFLSNMSHEFRTPLNAIVSLTRMLLDRTDGELTQEQERQVQFVRKSALDLSELVNDLLDLAKVEAGKVTVRAEEFEVGELFGALRGMLRPLLGNSRLELVFDEPANVQPMCTDQAKVSQVLRNFISNALKFTEQGEVRVSAEAGENDHMIFTVSDTGIGIAPEDQARIFDEFVQIDSPQQRKVKGTGLGLPLSRKLAQLLGGSVWLESQPGAGSKFYLAVPRMYAGAREVTLERQQPRIDPARRPVLIVEDNPETLFLYEKYLENSVFQPFVARTVGEARRLLREVAPAAALLDILLEHESTWGLLAELKSTPERRRIPVIVATVVDNRRKAEELGADAFAIKPVEREWLLAQLARLTAGSQAVPRLLLVDDDEISRYLLKGFLPQGQFAVYEATGGVEGLRMARELRPAAIFLDLLMPDMSGLEVLRELKADPETAAIPVIINTTKRLDEEERELLLNTAAAVVSKEAGSRDVAAVLVRQALARAGVTTAREQASA